MNWVTRSVEIAWGLFAWFCFGLSVLASLVVVLIVPSARWRQQFVGFAARMIFVLARVDVRVTGMENLPAGDCVVVANHASYLDGPLLRGYLPWRFRFVIKGEMRNFGPAHFLLRRSGSEFVERSDQAGSTRDARRIVKAAQGGDSLAFFPEGTFQKDPGVLRFRPGAFVAATRGGMAVVPVAIRGSRFVLPSERLLPRRGPLEIDILPPIEPTDPEFASSRKLAETARQRIIRAVNEPDLLGQTDQAH